VLREQCHGSLTQDWLEEGPGLEGGPLPFRSNPQHGFQSHTDLGTNLLYPGDRDGLRELSLNFCICGLITAVPTHHGCGRGKVLMLPGPEPSISKLPYKCDFNPQFSFVFSFSFFSQKMESALIGNQGFLLPILACFTTPPTL
jgi:hypothetical protein